MKPNAEDWKEPPRVLELKQESPDSHLATGCNEASARIDVRKRLKETLSVPGHPYHYTGKLLILLEE